MKVDNKSKVLLIFVATLVILSLSATFYKTVILQDFEVYMEEDEE